MNHIARTDAQRDIPHCAWTGRRLLAIAHFNQLVESLDAVRATRKWTAAALEDFVFLFDRAFDKAAECLFPDYPEPQMLARKNLSAGLPPIHARDAALLRPARKPADFRWYVEALQKITKKTYVMNL